MYISNRNGISLFYNTNLGWRHTGTSSTASFAQTHYFKGNINGVAKHDTSDTLEWTSRSGGLWYDYVESYVDEMASYPDYHRIDRLGTIKIYGYNKVFNFTPVFGGSPNDII